MLSLGHKFGNGLTHLNDASICNPDFIWVKSTDKIVQVLKSLFSIFTQTISFKKTGLELGNECFMTSLKIKTLRRKRITIDYQIY